MKRLTLLLAGWLMLANPIQATGTTETGALQPADGGSSVFVPMSDEHLDEMQQLLDQVRAIPDTDTRYQMLQTYLGTMFTRMYSTDSQSAVPAARSRPGMRNSVAGTRPPFAPGTAQIAGPAMAASSAPLPVTGMQLPTRPVPDNASEMAPKTAISSVPSAERGTQLPTQTAAPYAPMLSPDLDIAATPAPAPTMPVPARPTSAYAYRSPSSSYTRPRSGWQRRSPAPSVRPGSQSWSGQQPWPGQQSWPRQQSRSGGPQGYSSLPPNYR